MRSALALAMAATITAGLVACSVPDTTNAVPRASNGSSSLDAGVSSVPHRAVSPMPTARLAKGLIPPTNRWFSGLVFGNTPLPVFPLPLSFGLTQSGFAFGVPAVSSTPQTIFGEYAPAITVNSTATSSEIVAYDAASVTIDLKNNQGVKIGRVVIAEGSPVVSYTALHSQTLSMGARFTGSKVASATANGSSYGLVTSGRLAGTTLALKSGQAAEWFAVPKGGDVARLGAKVSSLRAVSVGYSVHAKTASTTLTYDAAGGNLVAALPQQVASLTSPATCSLGSYPSVYGTLSLCSGHTLSWTVPTVTPSNSLDASRLTTKDKSSLRTQLSADVGATKPLPSDTYFGGKALYRLANLLTLAHQVGDQGAAKAVQGRLASALEKWTEPKGCASRSSKCFVYDPAVKGIVGLKASFGSDQFNDHHFHYGYFLYAASVASKYDPALAARLAPVMNLLAADIGTDRPSSSFPVRRLFDAYSGHSWASGYAPFADGNNQESSSEAVDAWNGLALWGQTTGNTSLATEAKWMLSAEAASAKADYTNFDQGDPVYSTFRHSTIGINWGGKRDYASWFSALPSAILSIQLIPMSPASTYLGGDSKRIAKNIAGAAPQGYDIEFGDYLLMYSALEGPAQAKSALRTAKALPAADIDDADSKTYLLAWIMTHQG